MIQCQDSSVTSSSWWSLIPQGASFSRDEWPFPEEESLLVPLILECSRSFADNQRTIGWRCAPDTKSATITFTFTLHYWIFIHWALSQWVMSWMIDEANAFCLRSSRIDTICRAFTLQNGEAAPKNTKIQNCKSMFFFTWHWIMGHISHVSMHYGNAVQGIWTEISVDPSQLLLSGLD